MSSSVDKFYEMAEAAEERMKVIGQNGNDGLHYSNEEPKDDFKLGESPRGNDIYIGVDPGKTGFITILENDEDPVFIPMPYSKVETGEFLKSGKPVTRLKFDEYGFEEIWRDIALKYVMQIYSRKIYVAIEEVQGRGGWSATNNFNFGYIAGMLKMFFIIMGIKDIVMVRPQKWQSYMRQGYPDLKKASSTGKTQVRDPKAVAEMIVKTEFPDIDFRKTTRAKKNDDNKIDSFLIAQYLKRIKTK